MRVRFSPRSELLSPADGEPAAVPVAALPSGVGAAGRSMKRFGGVSSRLLIATRSSLESGKLAQSLLDVLTLAIFAWFAVVFAGAVGWSVFILVSGAFK
jgi:hypothetical protein